MQTINFYLKQLASIWDGANKIASQSHRNSLSLMTDFLYCHIRYGCLPRQYLIGNFWNKSENDRKDILTYRRIVKLFDRLNKKEDIHILENKAHFNAYFSNLIHRDWILSSESSPDSIKEFFLVHNKVLIKPLKEQEGNGIYKQDVSSVKNLDEVSRCLAAQDMMIEEILVPHPKMVLGNTSVNTIRVHTLLDSHGKAHILSCILRAGVGDSVVDNYCCGGVIYPVDVEYGFVDGSGKSKAGDRNIVHPRTNINMIGYQIPNWKILCRDIKSAAERLPSLRFIGWDVAITDYGIALIEGNHNPDYELFEFIGKGKSYKQIKELL